MTVILNVHVTQWSSFTTAC